ncbi:MAG: hypothetical protein V4558_06680 [Gemmatimonadota bacterium]
MAKPLTPTPAVKGKQATKIQNELRRGTPDTEQRIRQIDRADRLFKLINDRNSSKRV